MLLQYDELPINVIAGALKTYNEQQLGFVAAIGNCTAIIAKAVYNSVGVDVDFNLLNPYIKTRTFTAAELALLKTGPRWCQRFLD